MKSRLDLNLVFVAESLFRHLNVSRAAAELGVTQSAVSHALAKLRDHFNDPLFVRVPRGVEATEVAKGLRPAIDDLAQRGRELERGAPTFDPATARGRFTIAGSDYVELLLMPRLLPRLRAEAPDLQISLRPTGGELPKVELGNGTFDVACAGFYRNLPEGFFQTKLFSDDFAVGCRREHPLAKGTLTRDKLLDADHALITLQGDFKLGTERARQRIVYGTHSFSGMAWVIASNDLLLVAPRRLLEAYRERFDIRIHDNPIPRSGIEIRLIWHALTHRDPLKRWVRDRIKEALADL